MRTFLILLPSLIVLTAQAQKVTLSGYVYDAKTQERLIGANVFIPELNVGASTNNFGFYSITCTQRDKPFVLLASYIGYSALSDTLSLTSSMQRNFSLHPDIELAEVVVKSSLQTKIQNKTQMSSVEIPMETIKKLPSLLGEIDVMKSLQLLPGIQAGNEGQSGLYVRGGAPDQNLILLDGVPVYNANHLFGFFSVFNPDAISHVEVYKGGFPARYGGRLSSVLDIRMKEGTKEGIHGNLGIGLLASRLMLEGPLGKTQKGSWIVSGRRSYIDAIMAPVIKSRSDGSNVSGYYFGDINAKANYRLTDKDRVYISAYAGKDKFYSKGFENKKKVFSADINWGNITSMFRWNHQFNGQTFGNLTGTYSQYQFTVLDEMQSSDTDFSSFYQSKIRDMALKYDVDFVPSPKHYVRFGASATYHVFTPGAETIKGTAGSSTGDTSFENTESPEFEAYLEDDMEITRNLKANIGLHFSAFQTENNFYSSVQPRISARYLVTPDWSIKASYCTMSQFIHLLSNSTVGLPTDLWLPVTDKVKPQLSSQAALGVAHTLKNDYEFSMEAFYKKMNNVIEYKDGASYLNTNDSWEDKVEMGTGWSYGAEFFMQKKTGRLTGLAGYTLSWSDRKFPTINNGKLFPYKFDRRHDLKVAALYKWKKNIELSAAWVFGTGNAITMPIFSYSGSGTYDLVNVPGTGGGSLYYYGDRNNYRMKPYHRLDLGINFNKTTAKGNYRTWNISIYNVYSRANPYFIYAEMNPGGRNVFKQMSLFPIIPSVSYNLKF